MKTTQLNIKATMTTDDGVFDVNFNAAPFFENRLKTGGVKSLMNAYNSAKEEDFGSGYGTDDIALFFMDYKDADDAQRMVDAAFKHNELLPSSVEARGFSCSVSQEDLEEWMKINAPESLSQI